MAVVPSLGALGVWRLKNPWTTKANMVYRCIALRRVEDLTKQGVDIFKAYYEPMGLGRDIYTNDVAANVTFVSLLGNDGSKIYVPSTFIDSIPVQSNVIYEYTILTLDLGPQPNSLDLSILMDEIKTTASDFTGIDSNDIFVDVGRAQSTTTMTQDQFVAAEEARTLRINSFKPSSEVIREQLETIRSQEALVTTLIDQIEELKNRLKPTP